MAQKALTVRAKEIQGSVLLVGDNIPDGKVSLTRAVERSTEPVRGGELTVTTGGFIVTDSEPPFGKPITYRVRDQVVNRFIQSNRVLNPKAGVNVANVFAGVNRALAREVDPVMAPRRDGTTSFRIGPNTAPAPLQPSAAAVYPSSSQYPASSGLFPQDPGIGTYPSADVYPGTQIFPGELGYTPESRQLLRTSPSGFGAGTWFISGQVMYDSPDLWLWQDVKDQGTWGSLKGKGTWQQVKSSSSEAANQAFTSVWASVIGPTGTEIVAPFQVLGATVSKGNTWLDFSFRVTLPQNVPNGSQLVLSHGQVQREFAATWWISTLLATPAAEYDDGGVYYFDGDSTVPFNSAQYLVPGFNWEDASGDASMAWNGTPNNSISVFTGPSVITAVDTITLGIPADGQVTVCEPVLISDPVVPQLGLWFGLLKIGPLSFASRGELYATLGRGAQIAVSQRRGWAEGELTLLTNTLAEASIAERLFESGRILFLRNPDPRYPETDWYLHIGTTTSDRLGADQRRPERAWTVPFVRVERPVGLIAASTAISWGRVKDSGVTWGDLRRSDWLDVAITTPVP